MGELSFNEFEVSEEAIKGKPIICTNCGAILTNVNSIKNDEKIGVYFKCLYCGSINKIDAENLPGNININYEWYVPPDTTKQKFGEGVKKREFIDSCLRCFWFYEWGKIRRS
ncbi:MAG: hypothetical protein U9O98_02435 [Asgard group archaeon]|nr:hypothetical protein [Asgard group archaeon]